MTLPVLGLALVYLALINFLTYALFELDKERAVSKEWRIPELTLLTMALFGGWFGAKYGQRKFRHKTRKQPFATLLNVVVLVPVLLGSTLLIPDARHQIFSGVSSLLVPAETSKPERMPVRFGPGS